MITRSGVISQRLFAGTAVHLGVDSLKRWNRLGEEVVQKLVRAHTNLCSWRVWISRCIIDEAKKESGGYEKVFTVDVCFTHTYSSRCVRSYC